MRAAKSNLATLRRASQGTRSSWSQTISLALIDKSRTASSRDEGWATAQPDQFGGGGSRVSKPSGCGRKLSTVDGIHIRNCFALSRDEL